MKKILKTIARKLLKEILVSFISKYQNEIRVSNSLSGKTHVNIEAQETFNRMYPYDSEFVDTFINEL